MCVSGFKKSSFHVATATKKEQGNYAFRSLFLLKILFKRHHFLLNQFLKYSAAILFCKALNNVASGNSRPHEKQRQF